MPLTDSTGGNGWAKLAAKSETQLIWLNLAFLKALGHSEEAEGVPTTERLGSVADAGIGELDVARPSVPATGPQFRRQFTSKPQPKRGGGTWPATEPRVPALPNRDQLAAMLHDNLEARDETKLAERRACEVHRQLIDCLSSGRIKAWAEEWIADASGERLTRPSGPVAATYWRDCQVDYRDGTVQPSGGWETRVEGHRLSGQLLLREVALDENALDTQLKIRTVDAELWHEMTGGREIWTIKWSGSSINIECTKQPSLSRALHAIETLLRNPKRSISCHLLAGLNRRKVAKVGSDPESIEINRVRGLIDSECLSFLRGEMALAKAAQKVREHVATLDDTVFESSTRFARMEYDLVLISLKGLKDRLRKECGTIGSDVATFLDLSVRHKSGGYRYEPNRRPITWHWRSKVAEPG
jgi:hypothetical protein